MVSAISAQGIALKISQADTMRETIERITEDIKDIRRFFSIEISPRRTEKLSHYLKAELQKLSQQPFNLYDQEGKVDYLLLKNYLHRQLRQLERDSKQNKKTGPLLLFASTLVDLCEARAKVLPIEPKNVAQRLFEAQKQIAEVIEKVETGSDEISIEKSSAFRAAKIIDGLKKHLEEWFGFYDGYDPVFRWWVMKPYEAVDESLEKAWATIREKLVGITLGDEDEIVGQPIGREGLLAELQAEMIPYTPEEIISIGETEFDRCIGELKAVSRSMGLGDNWPEALEQVKNDYVEPGQQTQLVHQLAQEAITFVEKHGLVTVPAIAKDTWQTFMMSPERQKVNPFFLGGESIIVSYPTDTMDHKAKLMSMRGNNIHFARSTVFHELIPGHHLQLFMNARHRPYRRLFKTPFWMEGWALYWEFILWDNDHFPKTPQNRIGMLWWRLHRCARIIFSLKFHLGQMSPQECIDLLVNEVHHERATAEGEVRRSFNGNYSPLYQAGYMLGALQIYALRKEIVDKGDLREIDFHDRFLRGNRMPIELARALMKDIPLSRDSVPSWKFY